MIQLSLAQCPGFKKKKTKIIEPTIQEPIKQASIKQVFVLPARLEGKIKVCEECGTLEGVEIHECMYLCNPCYSMLGEPQTPVIFRESYPVKYLCKLCDSKAVLFDDVSRACFCVTHAIQFLGGF